MSYQDEKILNCSQFEELLTDYLDGTAVFNINLIGSAYLPTAPTGSPVTTPNTDPGTPPPVTPIMPVTPTNPYDYYY